MKNSVSKSRKHAQTSTESCQHEGASDGNSALLRLWSSAVTGSTTVRYLNNTDQKQTIHLLTGGVGPESEEILQERTRMETVARASRAKKGTQQRTCVRKAQDAGRYGESRICSCPVLTCSHRACKTGMHVSSCCVDAANITAPTSSPVFGNGLCSETLLGSSGRYNFPLLLLLLLLVKEKKCLGLRFQ